MDTLTQIFKGYTIELDYRNPYSTKPEYMFYPTHEGTQHDADYDGEQYRYCGNCKWADSIEEAKDEISGTIMVALPDHIVKMNGRFYPFPWIEDAMKFAIKYDGELYPVINA